MEQSSIYLFFQERLLYHFSVFGVREVRSTVKNFAQDFIVPPLKYNHDNDYDHYYKRNSCHYDTTDSTTGAREKVLSKRNCFI